MQSSLGGPSSLGPPEPPRPATTLREAPNYSSQRSPPPHRQSSNLLKTPYSFQIGINSAVLSFHCLGLQQGLVTLSRSRGQLKWCPPVATQHDGLLKHRWHRPGDPQFTEHPKSQWKAALGNTTCFLVHSGYKTYSEPLSFSKNPNWCWSTTEVCIT